MVGGNEIYYLESRESQIVESELFSSSHFSSKGRGRQEKSFWHQEL
jgi:hypothetical protein